MSEITRRAIIESVPRPVRPVTRPPLAGPFDPDATLGSDDGPEFSTLPGDNPFPDNPFGPTDPHAWPAAVVAGAAVVAAAVVTVVVTLVRASHGDDLIRVIDDMRTLKGLGDKGITLPRGKSFLMANGGTFGGLIQRLF